MTALHWFLSGFLVGFVVAGAVAVVRMLLWRRELRRLAAMLGTEA